MPSATIFTDDTPECARTTAVDSEAQSDPHRDLRLPSVPARDTVEPKIEGAEVTSHAKPTYRLSPDDIYGPLPPRPQLGRGRLLDPGALCPEHPGLHREPERPGNGRDYGAGFDAFGLAAAAAILAMAFDAAAFTTARPLL